MPETDLLIKLRALRRVFSTETVETHALAGLDLDIRRGEYVTIEGPSGCGKSTLLSILGLLDEPSSGEYELAGTPAARIGAEERARLRNREIGFVFQSFNLIPEMTVAENVGLPLMYRAEADAHQSKAAVNQALDWVNMSARAGHRPAQLSGGQQQRVAVARALVGGPSLVLADEPTGNLDQENGDQIMALLDDLHAQGVTLLTVTHNRLYAARAERRLNMLDGELVPGMSES